jgi:hypothetical protein
MPPTGMLVPARIDLQAVVGADFSATINLYQDIAQALAFDLTGYTCTFTISGTPAFTLTSGSGLTVTPAAGLIVAALTSTQTATMAAGSYHYSLKLVDGSGLVSYPLNGSLFAQTP